MAGLKTEFIGMPRENEIRILRRIRVNDQPEVDVIPFDPDLWEIDLREVQACYQAQLDVPEGNQLINPIINF